MGGILSGVLGVLALPPFQIDGLALVWLTPWFIGLRRGSTAPWLQSTPVVLTPVIWSLGDALIREPVPSLALLLALATSVAIATTLVNPCAVRLGALRVVLGGWLFVAGLAAAREIGAPLSLALLAMPAAWATAAVAAFGVVGVDLLIVTLQALTAIGLTETFRCRAMPRGLTLVTTVHLAVLLTPGIAMTKPTQSGVETRSIAAIQTATHPVTRDFMLGDHVLEQWQARQEHLRKQARALDADWWVWPEAAIPGYLNARAAVRAPDGSAQITHGYSYRAPGELQSVAIVSRGDDPTVHIRKRDPLPGAEHYLAATPASPLVAEIDGIRVGVLICSDALNQRAVDQALTEGAQVLISPLNSAYIANQRLARVHQDMAHLQAARTGLFMLLVGNGGPTALLSPDGPARTLLPFYKPGVARVEMPIAQQTQPNPHAPWIIAGTLCIGAAMTTKVRRSPRQTKPVTKRWATAAGLVILLAVLTRISSDDTPPSPTLGVRFAAVMPTTGASHQGAIALIARAFGHPLHWSDIPYDAEAAMRWLCQTVGVQPSRDADAGAPGYGILPAGPALLAVRYESNTGATAYDPRTGRFSSAKDAASQILWLRTVQSTKECR